MIRSFQVYLQSQRKINGETSLVERDHSGGEREDSDSSAQVVEELCTIQRPETECAKGAGKGGWQSTGVPTKNWRWEREDYSTKDIMKEQGPKHAESWNKGKYRGKQKENFKTKRQFVYVEGH